MRSIWSLHDMCPSTLDRGRAILDCLAHGHEPWARSALESGAKPALAYLIVH